MPPPITTHVAVLDVEQIIHDIRNNDQASIAGCLDAAIPEDIADMLTALLPSQRSFVWPLLSDQKKSEIIPHLRSELRSVILDDLDDQQLIQAAEIMDIDVLESVVGDLPDQVADAVIEMLEHDHRQRLERVLSFDEGTAGRLMHATVLSVRKNVTFSVLLRWLRLQKELPPSTDALMVVDVEGRYLGKLALADILTAHPERFVEDVMTGQEQTVHFDLPEQQVAVLFEKWSLQSIAVVDDAGMLCGRILVDDVMNVIRNESDQQLLKLGGMSRDEDLFAPVLPSAKRRGVWLGINMLAVFITVWVIGLFEHALEQIVALAVLMPITASMGGIYGNQTLMLVIRGMALNQVSGGNTPWLIRKELAIAVLNGAVWSLLVAAVAWVWFEDAALSMIIAVALMINFLSASFAGVSVPLVLKRLGIDPGLSGPVIVSTITDVIGFLCFLGMASVFLLGS